MLRKVSVILFIVSLIFVFTLPRVCAQPNLASEARSAILIDRDSGTVIFEKNSHEKLPPASMTKIATMLLVMEAIEKKKISLNDMVQISEHAASMGGSQIFLEPGEKMSVNDLLKGVAISSGNDASVALAEYIAGSEAGFVQMMNDKVKQLGLKGTHFGNPNGLSLTNHYSTAYDMAMLSRELLKYEEVTKYTGVYEDYLRKNSKKPFWLVNTNKLVKFYEGVDGLKTGFTSEARFCLSATAKRNHFRVIAVVMGEPNVKTRNKEVSRLLDYAFNQYTNVRIFNKNDLIAKKKIEKGDPRLFEIRATNPYSILIKKGEDPKSLQKHVIWHKLKAPIHKGDVIGKIQFEKNGKLISEMKLVSTREVKEPSLWSTMKRTLNSVLLSNDS